jgi:hypothetical protein
MELIERDENGENNASAKASRLHELYDPRHREPSYWYCLFNLIYFVWFILVLCYICWGLKYVYLLLTYAPENIWVILVSVIGWIGWMFFYSLNFVCLLVYAVVFLHVLYNCKELVDHMYLLLCQQCRLCQLVGANSIGFTCAPFSFYYGQNIAI